MIRKALSVAAVAAMCAFGGGCATDGGSLRDGPVAPEYQSSEKSGSGDPALPYMKPWWRD